MVRKLITAGLFMYSACVTASPDQIDIIGIRPGVTTVQDLTAAGNVKGNIVYLEIGGYSIPCMGEFKNNELEMLACMTGGKATTATNTEIHQTLVKGFTTKFGSPEKNYNETVRTRVGVEYQSNEVWWTDTKGNGLILYSIRNKIDEGGIMMYSDEIMQKMKSEAAQKEQSRKF